MNNTNKRIFASIMAAIVTVSMLAGCGEKPQTTESSSDASKTESVSAAEDKNVAKAKDGTAFNKTGLPIVNEPYSFTVMAVTTASDPTKFPMNIIYEKNTNIQPEWVVLSPDGLTERKNLMWASDDYPEVLGPGALSDNDIDTYGPVGAILPINAYIDEYLGTFKENIGDGWDSVWRKMTYPDGSIYAFPTVTNYFYSNTAAPAINITWLEKLNMEIPTTPDELLTVLKAFRDQDPNGNQKKDEIPLTASNGPLQQLLDLASWTGELAFTLYVKDGEDGKVSYPLKSDQVKESLKWLRMLNKEKLMDPEIFTQDDAAFLAKAKSGDLTYGLAYTWREGHAYGEDKKNNYFAIEPLKGANGTQLALGTRDKSLVQTQLALTSACRAPEIVTRWVDAMYDPIMSMEGNVAPIENGGWEKLDNGKYKQSIPEGYENIGAWLTENQFQQVPRLLTGKVEELIEVDDITKYGKGNLPAGGGQKEFHDLIRGKFVINALPNVKPTPEETEELALYEADFNKYVSETLTRFITGQLDIDAEWANYCAQVDKLGYEKILAVHQQQYDRYCGK